MMTELELQSELERQGFRGPNAVRSGESAAGVFGRGSRCGIYVLHFADGQYYVGQSVNVSRRFLDHSKRHKDIASISFRSVAREDLDRVEYALITQLETGGVALRNIDGMNVPLGDRVIDEVVAPDEQFRWRTMGEQPADRTRKWTEETRRRERDAERAMTDLLFREQCLPVLQRYVRECLMAPERTERDFWACSCLPGGGQFYSGVLIYARVNVYEQEVLTAFRLGTEARVGFTFHLQASTLQALSRLRRLIWRLRGISIDEHRYSSGGTDQLSVHCRSARAALALMDDPLASRAMREFTWRLMRKGTCLNKGSHVLALADVLLSEEQGIQWG